MKLIENRIERTDRKYSFDCVRIIAQHCERECVHYISIRPAPDRQTNRISFLARRELSKTMRDMAQSSMKEASLRHEKRSLAEFLRDKFNIKCKLEQTIRAKALSKNLVLK